MNDLPKGYRWAREEEMSREDAIVVPRTVDSQGTPYTQGEADVAVPYSDKSRPNNNYILDIMRDCDVIHDPWGTAMSWAFAVAESLTAAGAEVPAELGFTPSPYVDMSTWEPESWEDNMVWEYLGADSGLTLSRVKEVQFAGKCLARYIDWCKAAGRDY